LYELFYSELIINYYGCSKVQETVTREGLVLALLQRKPGHKRIGYSPGGPGIVETVLIHPFWLER